MQTKICTKCKRELPVEQFQSDKSNEDGFYPSCKDCKKEYRRANKEKLLIAQYLRRSKDLTITPERRAWNALYYALKTGKIDKPEVCSVCGKPIGKDKIQGHHRDYSKPFEVVWCCQDCHVDLDKVRREVSYA